VLYGGKNGVYTNPVFLFPRTPTPTPTSPFVKGVDNSFDKTNKRNIIKLGVGVDTVVV